MSDSTTHDLRKHLEIAFLEIRKTKINYPFAPIPCPMDEKIRNLVCLYLESSLADRLTFYEQAESVSGFFLTFAERSAALAVREQSRHRVLDGLVALLIENCQAGDYRDTLTHLASLYHAACKIGEDANAIFKEVASYADNCAAKCMRPFPDRPFHTNSLKSMGYREANSPTGFVYERYYSW